MFLKQHKYHVFSKVVVSNNIENGLMYLIQSSGLGGLDPNTVILAWPNEWEDDVLKTERFVNIIRAIHTYGHLITILKPQKEFDCDIKHTGTIDIWSFNFEKGMLLLIAYILKKSDTWRRCTVRLFVVTSISQEQETLIRIMREFLDRYRLFTDTIPQIVQVSPEETEQFTHNLGEQMEKR